ncbi:NAD-dependent protein deacetylase [Pokkaliibacter sp. CJK22405]|uniref:NAD-dependent protein deacetylase n=1 Tax=Pokkaliibacter sp. CJK22405 TaxID=3384615 RepID=UPI003984C964
MTLQITDRLPEALITTLEKGQVQGKGVFVITGAGISTDSGIPDYRDHEGQWKRSMPVQHREFMEQLAVRQRFWARSLIGWPVMSKAQPNQAHRLLADWELRGWISELVTQNVDGLHQKAGSAEVIDLHGRSQWIRCMNCDFRIERDEHHQVLREWNPFFAQLDAEVAPDGDADLELADFSDFKCMSCPQCQGILKPDVVFYGDVVPTERVRRAMEALERSSAVLAIGTSLMVFSSFRFCKRAAELEIPQFAINLGKTRADDLLHSRWTVGASEGLAQLTQSLYSLQPYSQ